ncbi:MAG: HEAT repeat domain-containing protein [Gemmatimonadetes bacterium]|nr:HEAT repeat domain-containing protein [Gemmatimonadota bacterium]
MYRFIPILSFAAAAFVPGVLPTRVAPSLAPAVAIAAPDSADALWRQAREALSDGDYDRAATLFASVRDRYPRSAYIGDSYYWQAFAMSRDGGQARLRRALGLLDMQAQKFASAGTVKSGEAGTLAVRLRGQLARSGDADAAAVIAERATAAERVTGSRSARTGRNANVPEGCQSEDEDERIEALNALLQMNAAQAMPILEKVLARRDKCSELLRRKAVFLISQKRSADAADLLLKVAKGDPDAETREQAVFWLSQVSDEKAEAFLIDLVKDTKDAELQRRALFSLAQRRSERAQQAVRDYATRADASPDVRQQAVFWIGQRRNEENAKFLRDLFTRTTDSELREKILFSLSQMKGFGNEQFVLQQSANTQLSLELRKQALFWAAQSGAVSTATLGELYGKNNDREMREQVIFTLSQRGNKDPGAVDKLLEIAKTEPDRELRKRAIFWLGQSKDPRAAQFLQQIIEK